MMWIFSLSADGRVSQLLLEEDFNDHEPDDRPMTPATHRDIDRLRSIITRYLDD